MSSKKLKESVEDDGNGDDRISDLHDNILQRILSFVDMETVVYSTTLLSKRWTKLWTSLPSLHFSNPYRKRKPEIPFCDFMDFVDRVLLLRDKSPTNIERLSVDSYYKCSANRVTSWIIFAAKHNVQELCLTLKSEGPLQLPHCLFTQQSVRVLKLISPCKSASIYRIRLILPCSFRLIQLQVLHLERVVFDAEWIVEILENCPALETLIIRECDQITNLSKLKIFSKHLKHLELELEHSSTNVVGYGYKPIMICTPKLWSLKLGNSGWRNYFYSLQNLISLVQADISLKSIALNNLDIKYCGFRIFLVLRGLWNCKHLTLHPCLLEVISKSLASRPVILWNLRSLKLHVLSYVSCIPAMQYLLRCSQLLETLIVEQKLEMLQYTLHYNQGNSKISDKEIEFDFDDTLDHLKTVQMNNFKASYEELKLLGILLSKASILEKIVFTVSHGHICKIKKWVKNAELAKFSRTSTKILISVCHHNSSVEFMTSSI